MIEPFERRRILFDGEINQPDKVASECICLGLGIKRTKAASALALLPPSKKPIARWMSVSIVTYNSGCLVGAFFHRVSALEEAPNFVADIKR